MEWIEPTGDEFAEEDSFEPLSEEWTVSSSPLCVGSFPGRRGVEGVERPMKGKMSGGSLSDSVSSLLGCFFLMAGVRGDFGSREVTVPNLGLYA